MLPRILFCLSFLTLLATLASVAQEPAKLRPTLLFQGRAARLVIDLAGGAVGEFRFQDGQLNPLSWATPNADDLAVKGFGHFLCLDRWGPASAAETAKGMPYHGEASHVPWIAARQPVLEADIISAEMSAKLPLAGLSVKRAIRFSNTTAAFTVREEITNENPLGRIYNAVQHPTIAPPFLDETTVVDCNGRKGFAQGGSLPNPEEPSSYWPRALNQNGESADLRHLTSDPMPNVASYTIDDDFGWVTAATPGKQLLIGYIWRTKDYPWVSLWRDVQNGKPSARGLEFGTTGLHQPYPVLVKKGRIFGCQLYEHLDAGETATKSYTAFLLKIPTDYAGVERITLENKTLVLHERGEKARELRVDLTGLGP